MTSSKSRLWCLRIIWCVGFIGLATLHSSVDAVSPSLITLHTGYYSNQRMDITCEATGEWVLKTKIHLTCPLVHHSMCFTNCTRPCSLINNVCVEPKELESIEGCTYEYVSNTKVRVTYSINTVAVAKNGQWGCSFRGSNSQQITVTSSGKVTKPVPEPLPVTQRPPEQPRLLPPIRKPTQIDTDNDPIIRQNVNTKRQSEASQEEEEKPWITLTKPNLVLGLIAILIMSVVINVIFCIRCGLVKRYIDNLRTGVHDQSCLEQCLCLSPDPYRKLSQNPNGSSSGGPRPPSSSRHESSCVYEDLNGINGFGFRGQNQPAQFETYFDKNGTPVFSMPVKMTSASPSPSNRSASGASYPYFKSQGSPPPGYFHNGYVLVTSASPFPSARRTSQNGGSSHTGSHHGVYDDVPMEPRPPTNGGDYNPQYHLQPVDSRPVIHEEDVNYTQHGHRMSSPQNLPHGSNTGLSNGFPPPPTHAQMSASHQAINAVNSGQLINGGQPMMVPEEHAPVCTVEPIMQQHAQVLDLARNLRLDINKELVTK